jgi:hypothetical protein
VKKIWSFTSRGRYRTIMSEDRILRNIFGPKIEKLTEGRRR